VKFGCNSLQARVVFLPNFGFGPLCSFGRKVEKAKELRKHNPLLAVYGWPNEHHLHTVGGAMRSRDPGSLVKLCFVVGI